MVSGVSCEQRCNNQTRSIPSIALVQKNNPKVWLPDTIGLMRVIFLITLSSCLNTALYNTAVTGSKNLKPPISFPVTTFYSFEKQNWIDDCQVVTDLPWRRNHELIYPGSSLYKEVFFQKKLLFLPFHLPGYEELSTTTHCF